MPGTMAVITSPDVTAEEKCPVFMSFYYNMYGKDIGQLKMQVSRRFRSNNITFLWRPK